MWRPTGAKQIPASNADVTDTLLQGTQHASSSCDTVATREMITEKMCRYSTAHVRPTTRTRFWKDIRTVSARHQVTRGGIVADLCDDSLWLLATGNTCTRHASRFIGSGLERSDRQMASTIEVPLSKLGKVGRPSGVERFFLPSS